MRTRTSLLALAVASLAIVCAAPAVAGPSQLPTDGRPIIATVIEVDEAEGTVMLSTAHGPVAVSVTPDIAAQLSVGDVVLVSFAPDDEDAPAASPRTELTPRERSTAPKANTI